MLISSQIVVANKNIVAVIKKPGQLSTPSRMSQLDQRPVLGLELQKHFKSQVFPVHRLDYEVGGIMLYALSERSHKVTQNWFLKKKIHKTYRALTHAKTFAHIYDQKSKIDEELTFGEALQWESKIQRGKKRSFISEHGEYALTQAKANNIQSEYIQWQLNPVTGKSHQLRLELSRRGYPIIGDELYGSNQKELVEQNWVRLKEYYSANAICLWAYRLDLSEIDAKDRLGLDDIIEIDVPF